MILLLSDERLLAESRLDQFRGSGPGGQKRNKTSNAVRLTHLPTRISVTATESRSLTENKLYALRRLRNKIAADIRQPIDLLTFAPPDWFLTIRRQTGIEASHRHPLYAATAALILDLLDALHGNPAAVGVNLGVSTTAILKFLESDPHFWTAANTLRKGYRLEPLTPRR